MVDNTLPTELWRRLEVLERVRHPVKGRDQCGEETVPGSISDHLVKCCVQSRHLRVRDGDPLLLFDDLLELRQMVVAAAGRSEASRRDLKHEPNSGDLLVGETAHPNDVLDRI